MKTQNIFKGINKYKCTTTEVIYDQPKMMDWTKKRILKEPQDRDYYLVGVSQAVVNLSEIREVVFKQYGTNAVIVGKTLEGKSIREEFV